MLNHLRSRAFLTIFRILFLLFFFCTMSVYLKCGLCETFAGESTINSDDIINILGKRSSHYQGCGFDELKFGMSVEEVKAALPQDGLTLKKYRSENDVDVYENRREFSFAFKNNKLFAVNKFFPLPGDGSKLIAQALEHFGPFEEENYFKIILKNTVSPMYTHVSLEYVLYNFGDTQAAILVISHRGSNSRLQESMHLSYIDTEAVQDTLEQYLVNITPQVSWVSGLIARIGNDGILKDFDTFPPNMKVDSFQYTPNIKQYHHTGEPEPEDTMDGWIFENIGDDNSLLVLDIDRARSDQYRDLPKGFAKGTLKPQNIEYKKIPKYLRDHGHMGILFLRASDQILSKVLKMEKVTHYKQDKLMEEQVNNIAVNAIPYCRIELTNKYIFELLPTNIIRFFREPTGEKIM